MSMTKSEFMRRCRILRCGVDYGEPLDRDIAAIAEDAGVEWDPEPTQEPTGDLSRVRAIDAEGNTWRPDPVSGWRCIWDGSRAYWSEIPQPATVLRPEGGER